MYCLIPSSVSSKEGNWIKLRSVLCMVKLFQIKYDPAETSAQLSNQTCTHIYLSLNFSRDGFKSPGEYFSETLKIKRS